MSQTTPRTERPTDESFGDRLDAALGGGEPFVQDEELLDDLSYSSDESDPELERDDETRGSRRAGRIAVIVGAAVLVVVAVLVVLGLRASSDNDADDGVAATPATSVATAVTGPVHVQQSATAYTDANLVAQTKLLMDSPGQALVLGSDAVKDLGVLATKDGLDACAAALGEADAPDLMVDFATFDGQPAAIVVATRTGDDAHTTAYAVGRDCTTGDPHILRDSVPVS